MKAKILIALLAMLAIGVAGFFILGGEDAGVSMIGDAEEPVKTSTPAPREGRRAPRAKSAVASDPLPQGKSLDIEVRPEAKKKPQSKPVKTADEKLAKKKEKLAKKRKKLANIAEKLRAILDAPEKDEASASGAKGISSLASLQVQGTSFTVDGQDEPYFRFTDDFRRDHGTEKYRGGKVIGPYVALGVKSKMLVDLFEHETGLFCGRVPLEIDFPGEHYHVSWDPVFERFMNMRATKDRPEFKQRNPAGFILPETELSGEAILPIVPLNNGYEVLVLTTGKSPAIFNLRSGEYSDFDQSTQVPSAWSKGYRVGLSSDDKVLVLPSRDGFVSLYDIPQRRFLRELKVGDKHNEHPMIDSKEGHLFNLSKKGLQRLDLESGMQSAIRDSKSKEIKLSSMERFQLVGSDRFILVEDFNKSKGSLRILNAGSLDLLDFSLDWKDFQPFLDREKNNLWQIEERGYGLYPIDFKTSLQSKASTKETFPAAPNSMRTLQPAVALSQDGLRVISMDIRGIARTWDLSGKKAHFFVQKKARADDPTRKAKAIRLIEGAFDSQGVDAGFRWYLEKGKWDGYEVTKGNRLKVSQDKVEEYFSKTRIDSMKDWDLSRGEELSFDDGTLLSIYADRITLAERSGTRYEVFDMVNLAGDDQVFDAWTLDDGSVMIFTPKRMMKFSPDGSFKNVSGKGHWQYNEQAGLLTLRSEKGVKVYSSDGKLLHELTSEHRIQSCAINSTATRVVGIHVNSGLSVWDLPKKD